MKRIKTKEIRAYLYDQSKKRGWSAKTFRNHLQSIATFYDWAIKKQYLSFNPTQKIEKPKLPKPLPRYLTKTEAQLILNQAEQSNWTSTFIVKRNYAIIATFLQTGVRLNELRHLKMSDIDWSAKSILVQKGKGNKMRLIPIHPSLVLILNHYLTLRVKKKVCSPWLFPSIRAQSKISNKYIHQLCKKISIETGVKFTPHMLRHTFGRSCTDQNLPFFKLKQIMGHSSIVTTERYASISMAGLQESFCQINFP
jgi:site-specific recombinase XerD